MKLADENLAQQWVEIAQRTRAMVGAEPLQPVIEWRRGAKAFGFAMVDTMHAVPEVARAGARGFGADTVTIAAEAWFTVRSADAEPPAPGELGERAMTGDPAVRQVLIAVTFQAGRKPVHRVAVFQDSVADDGTTTIVWNDAANDLILDMPWIDVTMGLLPKMEDLFSDEPGSIDAGIAALRALREHVVGVVVNDG